MSRLDLFGWTHRLFARPAHAPDEISRARDLIDAIDAGGVPLNPARVNAVARDLGLDVSAKAPVEATLERIRAALKRI
jgi:hypothetical protein